MPYGLAFFRRLPGLGRVVRALGLGGVPAAGYFGAGWSIGTLLLLYWLETLLVTAVVSVLVLRHRAASRKAGHWNVPTTLTTTHRGGKTTRSGKTTFLSSFLGVMVPFTLGHGIFVAVFAFFVFPQEMGPEARVSAAALEDGLTWIGIALLASLLLDLPGLGARPFRWVERVAERAQGRMIVTHLTIIFGAGAMAVFETPAAFLAVFVGLKSLLDLGGMFPDRASEPRVSRTVETLSRWLPKKGGKTFSEHYRQEIEAERTQKALREDVLPPPEASA